MGGGVNDFLSGAYNPASDPRLIISEFNDFVSGSDFDTTNDFTVTKVGLGTAAINNTVGGELVLTNTGADNDSLNIQKKNESYKFILGQKLRYSVRLKVNDATQVDLLFGLVITDTTAITNTDGVYFRKDDGDTDIDLVANKNSASSVNTGIGTLVDNTYIELALEYDGIGAITSSVNGVVSGSVDVTNLPDDEDLTVTFLVQNGEAVAKILTVDNYYVGLERS